MRFVLIFMLMTLFSAPAGADPIHYEQIPADVTSYFHIDVEQLTAARLSQVRVNDIGTVNQNIESDGVHTVLGGPIKSATLYSSEKGAVLLLHAPTQGFHDKVEAPHSTNTVVFDYDHQEVHCSSTNLFPGLFGGLEGKESSKKYLQSRLSVGLDGAASQFHGAFYTAYVGSDLIVMAVDLPAMAEAIDVLQGSKPSLAQQDLQGMKTKPQPGMFAVAAGLSAQWTGINLNQLDADKHPRDSSTSRPTNSSNSGFSLDLFGQFKGKAKLARFIVGEDDQNEYINTTLTMIDADSATLLKNLMLGVKALVQLSHNSSLEIELIDPLQVETNGSDVNLHWAIPTAKLSGLFNISTYSSTNGHPTSTSIPATEPEH